MGFWSFLERKKKVTQITLTGQAQIRMMPREAAAYADEGYSQCVVVYRCVDLLAKSLASIPLVLKMDDGTVVEDHEVLGLLENPNPVQEYTDLIEQFAGFYNILGNAFMEAIGPDNGPPLELYVYPSFSMKVGEPREGYVPLGYIYDDGIPDHARVWDMDPITGDCGVCHWKTFNPRSPFLGQSPMMAAAFAVDQHNGSSLWNKRLLDNNAAPQGAWVTEATLTPAQFGRMKEQVASEYAGAANARKSLLLEGGVDYKQFSLSPIDMDFANGKLGSAQDIAGAYGTPLQVIPLPGSQTFANYAEARLAYFEDTVIPSHKKMCSVLSKFLLRRYEGTEGWYFEGDTSKIPALAPRRAEQAAAINNSSSMTLNEKREAMGLAPVDDPAANMVYSAAGMLPIGFDNSKGTDQNNGTQQENVPADQNAPPVDEKAPPFDKTKAPIGKAPVK